MLLADGPAGYGRLAKTLSLGHLAGEKGAPQFTFADVADGVAGHAWALTGCRKGAVPSALVDHGPAAARRELERLVEAFGRDRVLVELWDHGDPLDSARNDALAEVAHRTGVECVATNNVHYATPSQRKLATAVAAVRARRSLDQLDPWLPAAAGAHLRSGAEQSRRFARYPGVVERAAEVGRAAAFDLSLVAPNLPPFPCPPGPASSDGTRTPLTEMQYLRQITEDGGRRRYGERPAPHEDLSLRARAWRTIDHELDVIEHLGFPGYFLVVWDLVEFCRRSNIFCQGRGSAANSAVCYALGVTAADAVSLGLLFERFLSMQRDGPPDIDIDIESDRREEVIQYVYERHGRHHTAQVANVITYRARSAVRDMAKALGYEVGQQDAWSKQVDGWGGVATTAAQDDCTIPEAVMELAAEIEDVPRHLGIHSGGMVMCDRPVIEVCPVEWGRMEKRSVLQWDKDDCAAAGLVKFDLLGLGMLSALHYAVDLIAEHRGYRVDLATIPQEDDVYAMLCRADTVGVFQIESRAQMATLPRLKPRRFYDLVVEVALIRPGPIQGGSVHPYIRRRNGQEPITYLHPLLENALGKTLGVPLFQEQLMQMAIDVAGFTAAESDELRQAMGSKRSMKRMERLRERLYTGMAERGITGDVADEIYNKMKAFANYGFPESHSVSFAYLVYASSWIKYHEPAAFCAALINAQPMGFWSPHTLVRDARRHGVVVRTPDLNASLATATLEDEGAAVRLGLGIGARGRQGSRRTDRARADRSRSVRTTRGAGPAGAGAHARQPRDDGDRRGVRRVLRDGPPPGTVGDGCRRPVAAGPARGDGDRRPATHAARDVADGGGRRRPVGHRCVARRPPDGVPARATPRAGGGDLGRAVGVPPVDQGDRRRRGHPPATPDDRSGRDVPQPRGRDRAHQRRGVEGMLGEVPHGRPQRVGDDRPRPARTERGSDQHRGRAPRCAPAGRADGEPRLPVSGTDDVDQGRGAASDAALRSSVSMPSVTWRDAMCNCATSTDASVRTVSAATLAIRHTITCPDGDRSANSPAGSRPTAPTRRFETPSAAADIAASPAASVLGRSWGTLDASANPSTLATSAPITPGTPWTSWSSRYRIEPMISVATPRYRCELTNS